jgi:3-hydroxyisobutyrate dehydrogenase-like beta-hydroxyacid dehydrogenase
MKQVLEVIGKGAAQRWQMDNRGKTMVDDKFDFGFAVDWMRKDLGLVPGRSQAQRRAPAGHRAGGPVLCRCPGDGRADGIPPA